MFVGCAVLEDILDPLDADFGVAVQRLGYCFVGRQAFVQKRVIVARDGFHWQARTHKQWRTGYLAWDDFDERTISPIHTSYFNGFRY
jgi:hypothetical protein